MQIAQVFKGDPDWMKALLTTLAVANEIKLIEKTSSSGSFIVVYDNAGGIGQFIDVLKGDPDDIADQITILGTVTIVSKTFSSANYLVVYV